MLGAMRWSHCIILALIYLMLSGTGPVHTQSDRADDGTLRRIRVPILMYHYVGPLPAEADAVRRDLTVEPPMFAAHLQYLEDAGYQTISLYDLYDALTTGKPLPPRPVILTFDDGYLDHYTVAFPLLQKHGFTATFFIITSRADANDPAHLNWQQIVEMARAGMSMEPHTKTHQSLQERDRDFLIYEILGSQESLKAHADVQAEMLAYPAGRYDNLALQITREIDFRLAVTTQPGMFHTTSDMLELPRVRVSGATSAAGLAYLLQGNWLN